MNLTVTKWRPDTCGCEIDYEWDKDAPAESRIHSAKNVITCEFHAGTKELVFEKVKTENTNKNKVYNKVLEDNDIAEDVVMGGGTTRKLKPGINVKWSFDPNRKLEVEIIGVDQVKKDSIATEIAKVVPTKDFNLK